MMLSENNLRVLKKTQDGQYVSPLHSEVSYFNYEGKLLLRVDLSAVDPEGTNVFSTSKKSGIKLAKGYSFGPSHFAIEIKLNKIDYKREMMDKWKKDLDKLEDIKTRNPSLTLFSILLDKKNRDLTNYDISNIKKNYPDTKVVYTNASCRHYFINFRDSEEKFETKDGNESIQ